jgi:Flp pilus assembly secretin CpaC
MTAFVARRVASRRHQPLLVAGMACLIAAFAAVAHPTVALAADPVSQSTLRDPVMVSLDQAKLIKLPERTSTLVIGNPLIADAAVQSGGVVVLTAKSYGMTNMVALDRNGATLVEYPIQVVGPADAVVVVFRGTERESYSCVSDCERRITLGDSTAYYGANLQAVSSFSGALATPEKK